MPETHTSKSTAPDGELPKESIIGYPAPDGESPSTEDLGAESEKEASGERLSEISDELGRLATGRRFYEPKPSDSQLPEQPADEREKLRAALRAAGKLGSKAKAESEPPTREEVLAALRGEYSSPAVEKANSGSDSSVADTESESVVPENQEEPGSSDEQDPNESPEVSDKQSPSGSEALKRLAEADTTQLTIRNMAGAAEGLAGVLNTADTLRAPVLFGRIQEFTSGILAMINRFNGAVEEVGGDLPQDEASRLGDRIGEIKRALTVLNNAVAKRGRYGHSNEDYLPYAMKLEDSITELQIFMKAPRKQRTRLVAASR